MKAIKKLQEKKIKLGETTYKPYTIGDLPPTFGFIYKDENSEDQDGIYPVSYTHLRAHET